MADIKISELLPASTPLDGTETLPIVQSGNTVKASTQDIASLYSLGYTAENVVNKSTDSSFAGATDLKYPSQLAVKTYVDNTLGNAGWGLSGNSGTTSANFIGTTDAQDLIVKTNGVERFRLDGTSAYGYFKGNLFAINGTNNTQIGAYQNSGGVTKGVVLNNYSSGGEVQIFPGNATNSLTLKAPTLSANKTLTFPNTNGTLVATVNGLSPDSTGNINVSSGWSLTGNSGTTAGTNFIGTIDSQDVVFKRNSTTALQIENGSITSYFSNSCLNNTEASFYASDNSYSKGAWITSNYNSNTNKPALALSETYIGNIRLGNLTADRTYSLPDKSGTLATTDDVPGYKVFSAIITQNGVSGLTITELKNTIGTITVSSYGTNPYYYYLVSSGLFTANKTMVIHGDSALSGADKLVRIYQGTTSTVEVYGYIAGVMNHTAIQSVSIEIRVYP